MAFRDAVFYNQALRGRRGRRAGAAPFHAGVRVPRQLDAVAQPVPPQVQVVDVAVQATPYQPPVPPLERRPGWDMVEADALARQARDDNTLQPWQQLENNAIEGDRQYRYEMRLMRWHRRQLEHVPPVSDTDATSQDDNASVEAGEVPPIIPGVIPLQPAPVPPEEPAQPPMPEDPLWPIERIKGVSGVSRPLYDYLAVRFSCHRRTITGARAMYRMAESWCNDHNVPAPQQANIIFQTCAAMVVPTRGEEALLQLFACDANRRENELANRIADGDFSVAKTNTARNCALVVAAATMAASSYLAYRCPQVRWWKRMLAVLGSGVGAGATVFGHLYRPYWQHRLPAN